MMLNRVLPAVNLWKINGER